MAKKESEAWKRCAREQFNVTVSSDLGRYPEERAAEMRSNKSAIVGQALETDRQLRKELLMCERYEEMAEEHLELAHELERVDKSAGWPNY